jgi:hypothetical protein
MSESLSCELFRKPDSAHAATAPHGTLVNKFSKRETQKSIKRSSATLHAQIISALQRGEQSRADLAADLESTHEVVQRFLNELRDLGVVYVKSRLKLTERQTNRTEFFALNPSPFQNVDAPRPPGSRSKERT